MEVIRRSLESLGLRPNTVRQYLAQCNTAKEILQLDEEEMDTDWLIDDTVIDLFEIELEAHCNSKRIQFFSTLKRLTENIYGQQMTPEVKGKNFVKHAVMSAC